MAEQAQLLQSREQLELEFATARERHSELLAADRAEWDRIRTEEECQIEARQAELASARDAIEHEILELRQHHVASFAAEQAEWERSCQQESDLRAAQHAEWLASRDAMLAASREALELEFITLREQNSRELQGERDEWNQMLAREQSQLEARREEWIREQAMIENRIRFQQDHLDKTRTEFEQAQNDYRRERQIELQRLEEANKLTIQRLKQVDLYRSSVDEREKSLDREQEVLNRTRKAMNSTADFDRLNFQSEKHAWEQERQIQQNDLKRQQESLSARLESLESRGNRLDKLRAELEETHRATLEMRLAVEESWAQLTDAAGQDEARQRVDQVRQSLVGYYQQMHESLSERRREHVESQSKFERQRTDFNDERQQLTTWLTKRDEDLRLGEERLRIATSDAATNHTRWLAARDRWLMEKTEAEQLIRRLLASLGENNRDQSKEIDAVFRRAEINVPFESTYTGRS